MPSPSSILNAPLHDPKADLKILFNNSIEIERTDYDILSKYIIWKFNQYAAVNTKDYSFWDCIQVDFEKFETIYFDKFYGSTWKLVKENCYLHEYQIDHNFGIGKTYITTMVKAVKAKWNEKYILKQIKWVVERYNILSKTICKGK